MADIGSFGLDVGIYGALADPQTILQLAEHAEEAGFEFDLARRPRGVPGLLQVASTPTARTGDFPSRLSEPLMEPVATMAVLVGATKRVRIGTAALIMPYRNPVLLARMLVTLDHFSGGRIVLGAGVGWLEEEFNVLDSSRLQAARAGHRRIPRDLQGDLRRRRGRPIAARPTRSSRSSRRRAPCSGRTRRS